MALTFHRIRTLFRSWLQPRAAFAQALAAETPPPVAYMRVVLAGWGLAALLGDVGNLGTLHGTGPFMAGVLMTGPLYGLLSWLCLSAGIFALRADRGLRFRQIAALGSWCFGPLCLLSLLQFAGIWLADGAQMEGGIGALTVLSILPLCGVIWMGAALLSGGERRPMPAALGMMTGILLVALVVPAFLFAQLANVSLF